MILYHYCDAKTFQNILQSKVLWLSDLTASNDDEELIRTFSILWEKVRCRLLRCELDRKIIQQVVEMLDNQFNIEIRINPPFGICFCRYRDELYPWCEYGDEAKGVSLGFEIEWFQGLQRKKPYPNKNLAESIGYDDVIYDNKLAEDEFFKRCYELINQFGLSAWLNGILTTFKHYSAFIKNPKFDIENECRIVYYPLSRQNNEHDFSVGNLQISTLVAKNKKRYLLPWAKKQNCHALKEITLGHNNNFSSHDLKMLLSKSGINNITILKSDCSYRSREYL